MSGYEGEREWKWRPKLTGSDTTKHGGEGRPTRKEPGRAQFERDRRDDMQIGACVRPARVMGGRIRQRAMDRAFW